jgi:hypothetical protein
MEFHAKLYQWPIIRNDIMYHFHELSSGSLDLYRLNFCMIILLQKVKDTEVLAKYRLICLLRVIYKIIIKLATIRFEPFMEKISFECQFAFIKGRNIMDRVLYIFT